MSVYIDGRFIKEKCVYEIGSGTQEPVGDYFMQCPCNTSCKCEYYPMTPEEKRCLDERKYWCFLLSSVVTFSVCVILVLLWRGCTACFDKMFDCSDAAGDEAGDEWADANGSVTEQRVPEVSFVESPQLLHPGGSVASRSSRRRSTASSIGATSIGSHVDKKKRKARKQFGFAETHTAVVTTTMSERQAEEQLQQISWMTEAKDYAGELISGQTLSGRVLVLLSFVLTLASMILYFYDASRPSFQVEVCVPWKDSPAQQMDFGLNMFFLAYFFIRLIAASDTMWFLMEVFNFVDFFTIPPSFVAMYLGRHWLGMRFLRALRLMTVPDILQYLNVLKTSGSIRLAQLLSIFISVSLAAAGFIHLLENSGDPWLSFDNPRRITYWECLYYLVVTMGTVGYGDLVCSTTLGRLFMIFFILGGLAMFASYIPEIVDIVGSRPKYRSSYEPVRGKKHVLLCGYVTYDSVNHLIRNFMLDEKNSLDIQLVFVHRKLPDLELEGLLKRHFTKMEFIHGSVMEPSDLSKVKADMADACMVLANKYATDPEAEDAANIMRVVSVKNYCSDTRVIVQLMQYHSKSYLLNIPTWHWRQGDDVVCLGELKLGMLAQNCLSPGISTMLANLFTLRPIQPGSLEQPWQPAYLQGSSMKIFMETLSHSFVGMSFRAAADFIFTRLRVLMIAIEVKNEEQRECNIVVNPPPDVLITTHTQGFFIAQTPEDVKRVFFYCKSCHAVVRNISNIKKCKCKNISLFRKGARPVSIMIKPVKRSRGQSIIAETSMVSFPGHDWQRERSLSFNAPPESTPDPALEYSAEEDMKFDSTGMFHWCPARPIEEAVLERSRISRISLSAHVVVCLFADTTSPLLGLGNYVMPMRASNLHYHELKQIVIVGNLNYLRREWNVLQNFPKLSILVGHPICRADLRAVNLHTCDICVIISARMPNPQEDPTLADKEAILASLNIKAMRFDDDRNAFLREYVSPSASSVADVAVYSRAAKVGTDIRLLTELANDTNVQFLDQEDEDDPDTSFHLTLPFACGHAFAVSVLDSLMSMTYFNDSTLTLIRALVTGGATLELEQILAEGAGLRGALSTPETIKKRNRCRIVQKSINHPIFGDFQHTGFTYGHMFRKALRRKGVLVLGLYRLLDDEQDVEFGKRLVITNPPPETFLIDTDMAFALQPFETGMKYSRSKTEENLDDDED